MKKDIKQILFDIDKNNRFNSERTVAAKLKKIYGENNDMSFSLETEWLLDDYVKLISNAKKKDGYVARTLNNITQKSLKNGYTFHSKNFKNVKIIEDRFEQLLMNSFNTPRSFLRELIKNCVSFSNAFIYKEYEKDKLTSLLIMPSKGWRVKDMNGPKVAKWTFEGSGFSKEYSYENIIHFSLFKETHEVFGTPFVISVLEDIQLLREIEAGAVESFLDSIESMNLYTVGTVNSPGTEIEISNLIKTISNLDKGDDLVVNSRVKHEIKKSDVKEPSVLLENFKERIMAGLMSSSSSMGISGSGRQDADTQSQKELDIIEDFQETIEDFINNTIIRELCLEEFGVYDIKNKVTFTFGRSFEQQEKRNNHFANLYNSGAIDFDEMREEINKSPSKFNLKKSSNYIKGNVDLYFEQEKAKITNVETTNAQTVGSAENTIKISAQPTNQYGAKNNGQNSKKN